MSAKTPRSGRFSLPQVTKQEARLSLTDRESAAHYTEG